MDEHGAAAPAVKPRFYRVRELAELLDVNRNVIYRDVAAGRITASRVGKGRGTIRIPERALAEYQANAVTEVAA